MGAETLLIASSLASAAGLAQSVDAQGAAAKAANKALDTKSKQNDLQFEQRKVAEYQKLNANLDRQQAIAAASGTSMRSPSLLALKIGTAKTGAQSQKNISVEQDIARANIDAEREAIKQKLTGGLFETLGQAGSMGSGIARSV